DFQDTLVARDFAHAHQERTGKQAIRPCPDPRERLNDTSKERTIMSSETKAYEEKISAQLQRAKAQLTEFEANVKAKCSPAQIETINGLNAKQQEIENKRQELKPAGDAKAGQVKAEIDADVAKLKTSLADLGTKLKKAG